MTDSAVRPWDGRDLADLFRLTPVSANHLRNRCAERNAHDRTYGGQLLAQALVAAAHTVPTDRTVSTMQFLFLQGTLHQHAIDFQVTPLQDGKRFTSRHVRGSQAGGRNVFDAQLSFATPLSAPAHMAPPEPSSAVLEDPETLPRPSDLPRAWADTIEAALGYCLVNHAVVDFRLPDAAEGLLLDLPEPRMRFWMKTHQALPDDAVLHAASFAYLSDWWLNYAAVGGHLAGLEPGKALYVASLNHAIWLHRPLCADDWLHFLPQHGDRGGGLQNVQPHLPRANGTAESRAPIPAASRAPAGREGRRAQRVRPTASRWVSSGLAQGSLNT